MRVLVVDDDKKITVYLKEIISSVGYVCDVAHTFCEATALLFSSVDAHEYNLVIMDRMLPYRKDGINKDGIDLLLALRAKGRKTAVIFFSALSAADNRISALESGADDYIPKSSLHRGLFLAKLRAVLRRCFSHHFSRFKLGNMLVDFHMQLCKMGDRVVPLTNKEYSMLELMCMHGRGAIISKEKFISHLYSNNEPTEYKIIDVFMCKLRGKLSYYNNGVSYIETVWGRGYTLSEKATPLRNSSSYPASLMSEMKKEGKDFQGSVKNKSEFQDTAEGG